MKNKKDKIDEGIKRLEKLKQATIERYSMEIDYDQELSLYDFMINHFVKGDLDDVFNSDVFDSMSESEKKDLRLLVREYIGLCFFNGDVDYWLDSLENTPISDFNLIAYSIFDCYDFLLGIAKDGGKDVLELLVSLRASEELRDMAIVSYLRNTFVDDKVLCSILLEMSKKDSQYGIFTDEQKGILLNYPEGTLYAYSDDAIKIISPLVLGIQMFNNVNSEEPIEDFDDSDLNSIIMMLKEFYRNENFDFYDETMNLVGSYRDYVRRNDISLGTDFSEVVFDTESNMIKEAWKSGDSVLGGTYDTPYTGGSK